MPADRPLQVVFFRLDSGREPVREWLKGMDQPSRRSIGEDKNFAAWVAGWNAARPENGGWSLGAEVEGFCGNCSHLLHCSGREYCALARIREESSEDAFQRADDCQTSIDEIEDLEMAKRHIGSSFDDFLEEEGLLEEVTTVAVKRYIAYQLSRKMSEENLSKAEMARRMETSRSALDRLLDPENSSVTLQTLQSAAQALGGRLKIELDFDHAA